MKISCVLSNCAFFSSKSWNFFIPSIWSFLVKQSRRTMVGFPPFYVDPNDPKEHDKIYKLPWERVGSIFEHSTLSIDIFCMSGGEGVRIERNKTAAPTYQYYVDGVGVDKSLHALIKKGFNAKVHSGSGDITSSDPHPPPLKSISRNIRGGVRRVFHNPRKSYDVITQNFRATPPARREKIAGL